MAVWKEPIYDRSQEDVEFAIQKIAEWKIGNNGNIQTYDLKGCLNVSDLNRIEGNIEYLSEQLSKLAYPPDTSTKVWNVSGLPNEQDISRILYNVRAIIAAYYQQSNAFPVPSSMLSYEDVNAVEQNLALIKELLDSMINSFKASNTFTAGSTIFLPTRRL